MSFRDEMFKYQKIQATSGKTGEGNNVLFSSRFCWGRLHFADSWPL
ncbi:MAG: hypothetical protein JG782_1167 [Anaerophaga sp.]|nr:hypothetical protein [Anaerophaga sp.]MDI3520738.1 hypothetical protein [Anaerophaga sp.]MDN5291514.1 hypothetical protein [Anaerophaga sp.]